MKHHRLLAILIAAGCGGAASSPLSDARRPLMAVTPMQLTHADGGLEPGIEVVLVADPNASCLRFGEATGSLDGVAMVVKNAGGPRTGIPDDRYCQPLTLQASLPSPASESKTSRVVITDPTRTLTMDVLDLLTQRTVTTEPAAPVFRSGDVVRLSWDNPNDVFPATLFDPYGLPTSATVDDCTGRYLPEIQFLSAAPCVPSTVGPRSVTFTIPSGLPAGRVRILWESAAKARPQITACSADQCSVFGIPYQPAIEIGIAQ
jgi:hypothetical protein